MNNWMIIHKYRMLCDEGKAKWHYHKCGGELMVLIGKDDEPALSCFECNITITPGLWLYDQMLATIKEIEDV